MIIYIKVILKEIFKKGRKYPWRKPEKCPRCGNYKVWGHGYVDALFDGYDVPLPLKRYRCPDCRCVIRYRPAGYFKRFQASIKDIRARIAHRLKKNSWLSDLSLSRQRHWLRALEKQMKAYLENTWNKGLLEAFDSLLDMGRTPVSRSI